MTSPYMLTVPPPLLKTATLLETPFHHLHTLYLFTAADFPTFAIPTTLFALFATLAGPPLTTNSSPTLADALSRIPLTLTITWLNLLLFNISNQRSPTAIAEDKINKPHRPLPAGRLSSDAARRVLLCAAPLVMAFSWIAGVGEECTLQLAFSWLYNDLGGCDEHWVLRNALIALGYGLFSSAALRVMISPAHSITHQGFRWIVVVTAVMFVTQHICDIKDAQGDRERGRRSAPIVLGDSMVRWSVAIPIVFSSGLCAWFFDAGVGGYFVTCGMGMVVVYRTLVYRDLESDRATWKLWALWTVALFALPLFNSPDVFVRALVDVRAMLWDLKCLLCERERCAGVLDLAAASGIAMVVEGRRMYAQGLRAAGNGTIPGISDETIRG